MTARPRSPTPPSQSVPLSSTSPFQNSGPSTPINSPPRRLSSPRHSGFGSIRNGSASRHSSIIDGAKSNSADRAGNIYSDRFIPSRHATKLDDAFDMMENRDSSKDQNLRSDVAHENQMVMNSLIRSELLGQSMLEYSVDARMDGQIKSPSRNRDSSSSNLFKYRSGSSLGSTNSAVGSRASTGSGVNVDMNAGSSGAATGLGIPLTSSPARRSLMSPKKPVRKISKTPFKVLDAPALQDDYYLNLVDWSHHNILAVALGSSVYLWSACTSKVTRLCDYGAEDTVTSISWATSGTCISVGTNSGKVQVWDASSCSLVRELSAHESRVGTMAWSSTLLASGSRDRNIYLQDIRIRSSSTGSSVATGDGRYGGRHGRDRSAAGATSGRRHSTGSSYVGRARTRDNQAAEIPGNVNDDATGADDGSDDEHEDGSSDGGTVVIDTSRDADADSTRSRASAAAAVAAPGQLRMTASEFVTSAESSGIEIPNRDYNSNSSSSSSRWYLPTSAASGDRYLPNLPQATFWTGSSFMANWGSGAASMETAEDSARTNDTATTGTAAVDSGVEAATPTRVRASTGAIPNVSIYANSANSLMSAGSSPAADLYGVAGGSLGSTLSNAINSGGSATAPCVIQELSAHRQEVCGLKWSFDEKWLASGGNDNKLFVWDSAQYTQNSHAMTVGRIASTGQVSSVLTEPLCRFEDHSAAVKAVAWSPHQHGLLASGGGTADRHIRFWNASTSVPLHKIDTGSQVCNLMWSKNVNEIVSTHGYSLNQVIVWKYPSMQKIATLTGHSLRVLYLAMSPDGQNIVTGAGDETLRFWNVFPGPRSKAGYRLGPSALLPSGSDIR